MKQFLIACLILITSQIQLLMSSTSKYRSTPTFSFRGWNKSVTNTNDPKNFPAPGLYNPEKVSPTKMKNSPSIKFAQSRRMQWDQIKYKNAGPGPGSHQPISYITAGPKKTINRTRFKQTLNRTPDPAYYKSNDSFIKKQSPSFSMQRKTLSARDLIFTKNSAKPSPGQYQQPIIKFHSSLVSIGKSQRPVNILKAKTPGPGSYECQQGFKKSTLSQSKCRIGKQIRKIDFSLGQRSPGPGNYKEKSIFQQNKTKQRGFSCRVKTVSKNHLQSIPGPGQYESPIIKKSRSAASIKIPQSARPSFTQKTAKMYQNSPGPGTHELEPLEKIKFRSMSVHKFSKSKVSYQLNPHKSVEHLSPFSYNLNDSVMKRKNPQFSISKHSQKGLYTAKIAKAPSPTSYNPNQKFIQMNDSVHKIQKSNRPNIIKHLQKNPGPGSYTFQTNKRLGRQFKFSKDARKNINDEKIKKQRFSVNESYQSRQQFPNPPKYMGVSSKIKFIEGRKSENKILVNEKIMSKYI